MPDIEGIIPFTIIDEHGRVVMRGTTMHLQFGLAEGQRILTEIAPENSYRAGESWVPLPPQPSANHVFDYVHKAWTDPRTIEVLREEKWAEIKQARAAYLSAGVDVPPFGRFDSKQRSVTNLSGYLAALDSRPADWTIQWTMFDNSTLTLDKEQFRAAALAVLAHVNTAQAISQALRDRINEANTTELQSIRWPP